MKKIFNGLLCFIMLISVTACNNAGNPNQQTETAFKETDVLIVGGGISGLTAALTAADQGVEVILIEKLGFLGGSASLSSGGFFTVNSEKADDTIDDSLETGMNYWHSVCEQKDNSPNYPDYELVENILSKTGETVDYFIDLGIDASFNFWAGKMSAKFESGAALTNELGEKAKEKGVEILLNCPGNELIVDDGVVTGVRATLDGELVDIKADKVILATGGFANSAEMIQKYVPEAINVISTGSVGNTGDGMKMAEAVDAKLFDDYWLTNSYVILNPEYTRTVEEAKNFVAANQLGINAHGERITNEALAVNWYEQYSSMSNDLIEYSDGAFYMIFDSSNPDFIDALEKGIELKEVVKGDTVEELASLLGMDEVVVSTTLNHYNDLCLAKEDSDFNKPAENLIALNSAPYYAVKYYPSALGSMGGVVTDINCHVINNNDEIVENLFAVGEMSNRAFYDSHYVGGASLSMYSTMGRIAAITAVSELK